IEGVRENLGTFLHLWGRGEHEFQNRRGWMPIPSENEMSWEQIRDTILSGAAQNEDSTTYVEPVEEWKTQPANRAAKSGHTDVEGDNLIDEIATIIRRYVFLKEPSIALLLAVWIVATYVYEEFDYIGYLLLYSPEPRSGKSTLLKVLNYLVAKSTGIDASPTQANIYRNANGCTQLFDEADAVQNMEALRSVLNVGFEKGSVVTRSDQRKSGGYTPKQYNVFAPRALAGVGTHILDRTTLDRTFAIAMVRQKKSEKRERLRRREVADEVKRLKSSIEKWVAANRAKLVARYRREFKYLDTFNDRTIDISEPLATVLEVAYEGSCKLEAKRGELLDAIRITRSEQKSDSSDHVVLRHLLSLTESTDPLVGNAKELVAMCGNLAQVPDEYALGRMLKRYGFKP